MPNLDIESIILIPLLQSKPVKVKMGYIYYALRNSCQRQIISIEERNIKRRIEKIYTLSDGKKIIVTDRKLIARPDDVDGILQIVSPTEYKWLSHRLLDTFLNDIPRVGLNRISSDIFLSWSQKFSYKSEVRDSSGNLLITGLRPPQIGGLHAIGAHWSLHSQPATIVMPTGTGKTEMMLATLIAFNTGRILVIVPSKVLREQTAKKFITLGLLRQLRNVDFEIENPIVGVIEKRPTSTSDLDIFDKCNVVVSTMSALQDSESNNFSSLIADKVDTLIVDEAHHIAADGWTRFREKFLKKKILQFTATPYRRDGRLVDGKVIYEYPLSSAQRDGYFKKISFNSIYSIDPDQGDEMIASTAIEKLRSDITEGRDHLMMARCDNISRATLIHGIYQRLAPDLNPILIHSESGNTAVKLAKVISRESKIVICVDMLGEGFDLPQLKIAAVHDTHKSLAILLQFTGRFTRSAANNIGDATVIANIANANVSAALERLYSEDADWNSLLSEFSSEAARAHNELVEFLNSSERLDDLSDEANEISHHLLHPALSTFVFEAETFTPRRFFEGLAKGINVRKVWLNNRTNTLFFVTVQDLLLKWTRSRQIHDRQWSLYILQHDTERQLLYLSSSDKETNHDKLAQSVGATKKISGDIIFRTLGRINRLIFQNIGVLKHGRRNLRFALYTGADVSEALSISERAGSVKSNLSGTGWENGEPTTIGCSFKGRIWSRETGTIPEFVNWAKSIGDKLKDETIDTTQIISNVLIPEEVTTLPDQKILGIDWPLELLRQSEDRVVFQKGEEQLPISVFNIQVLNSDHDTSTIEFEIHTENASWAKYHLIIDDVNGFSINRVSDQPVLLTVARLSMPVEEYFSNYPPLIRFIDLSELDGNLLIKSQSPQELEFPIARFEVWNWDDVDIRKESIWKDGAQREDSIQWRAANHFIEAGYEIIFDDDSAGEAADLICLKEEDDYIRLALVHCKFTQATTPGERIKDVVDVSSQAIRSAKWKGAFRDLCHHMITREKRAVSAARGTRFLEGRAIDLNKFVKVSRFKEIRPQILIVQPGISMERHTADQTMVLAAAYSYLKETIGVDLDVICSA
jgi:superfamily II DNA or RNA helicase